MSWQRSVFQSFNQSVNQKYDPLLVLLIRPQNDNSGSRPGKVAGNVAESSVQGDERAIFFFSHKSESCVVGPAKTLLKNMTSVMTGVSQRIERLEREVFVELEAHCSKLKEKSLPLAPNLPHRQSKP
jgi:hypothetical protein